MICILKGHRPQRCEGTGDREGRYTVLCTVCGKVIEEGTSARRTDKSGYRDYEQEATRV